MLAVLFELAASKKGLSQYEISHSINYEASKTSYCIKMAMQAGYVEQCAGFKISKNGKQSAIYRLTKSGRSYLSQFEKPEKPKKISRDQKLSWHDGVIISYKTFSKLINV